MAEIVLEFEKPIAELEAKLAEWESLSSSNNMSVDDELNALKRKIEETKKNIYSSLTPWQRVQLARHPNRPYTLDYIERIFTDFLEFHGDRRYADDPAIVGGFAQTGRKIRHGHRHPERQKYERKRVPPISAARIPGRLPWKALRLMKMADLAGVPVITFIDTPGAFPGVASEERHIGEALRSICVTCLH